MTVQIDDKADTVILDQAEYYAMIAKWKELDARIMRLEKHFGFVE